MIFYKRIDFSEGIDFSKRKNSVKCMICNYYFSKDTGFTYQPYVCSSCHGFSMTVQNFSDFFVVAIKKVGYRVYVSGVN